MSKNETILNQFELLVDQIKYQIDTIKDRKESIKHSFRLQQIKNAMIIIKKYPHKIKSGEELKDIKGIGKGSIDRINEIIKTGKLTEINIKKKDIKYDKYINELEHVFGIGRKRAYELVTKYNIKSIKELKIAHMNGKIVLTEQMMISLKHYNKYKQDIPRAEIDEINKIVLKIGKDIDKKLMVKICGSYRREKTTSNDIDILLTHPIINTKQKLLDSKKNYLKIFVNKLTNKNIILDDLTYDDYETKYMGYAHLSNKYPTRRIDIYYTPYESYYASLLHLTGSGNFNRKMRGLAIDLGYKLNEYGLFKGNKMIKIVSEKDIFDKLGMDFVEPKDR
jgi:DNA polymerase/3'-5' exonuclease PolX